jgi:hypothetical protein
MPKQTPFLDLADLRALTARMAVMLGDYQFTVYEDRFLGPHLRIVAKMEDTRNPGQMIDLGIDARIPPYRKAADFYHWVLWRLCEVAIHECREGFIVDGILWSDPHAEVRVDHDD